MSLLDHTSNEEERFSLNPAELNQIVEAKKSEVDWVILDEIQKVPKLLDQVHMILESPDNKIKFALTGSSARKLKRGSVNLLAGRAFINNIFPFTVEEIRQLNTDIVSLIQWGTLPKILALNSDIRKSEFLRSYAQTYLKEEIWAEHIVKNLDIFRRFLEVAAKTNSEIVNYSKLARQIGSTSMTIKSYFEILEETLIGFLLEPYHTSLRKRLIESPKFYLFDTGVKRAMDRSLSVPVRLGGYEFGKLFETFVISQVRSMSSYLRKDFTFSYLKTKDGVEIDLIIDRPGMKLALIEIKSSVHVDETELNNLRKFKTQIGNAEAFCFCLDKTPRVSNGIEIIHWDDGIKRVCLC